MSITTNYQTIDFDQAKSMDRKGTGAIVLRGCGGDEYIRENIEAINEEMIKEGCIANPCTSCYQINTNVDDRDDLVMVYGEDQNPNMGRFAMWRLSHQGLVSWLEDYIVNDADVHDQGDE